MAYRLLPLYDVDKPVGPNKPNLSGDVQLIRGLLSKLQGHKDPNTAGIPPIAASGPYDSALGAAILAYQQNTRKRGANMATDGVIDPMPKQGGLGDADSKFQNGVFSTLFVLNIRLFRINRNDYLTLGETLQLPWKPDPFELPT